MKDKELNEQIRKMITGGKSKSEVFAFVAAHKDFHLGPTTRGMLFEIYTGLNDGITDKTGQVKIEDLEKIHPSFRTRHGCDWARRDTGYLAKKYEIRHYYEDGSVSAVEITGRRAAPLVGRGIKSSIKKSFKGARCVVLDTGNTVEIDHKDGRGNYLPVDKQTENDFQPLSKPANDAKRYHCKVCRNTKCRYDARRLGYSAGWIKGDEKSSFCEGCYWYDPRRFNEEMSKGYKKDILKRIFRGVRGWINKWKNS